MPNGQYHGKTKGHGIRIKNPLPLSVWVHIGDGKGFYITRTVRPNSEIYVTVPHLGEYDIEPKILQYDTTGQSRVLGGGSWKSTPTVAVKPKANLQPGPVLIAENREVKSRRWVTVAEWLITKGFAGRLLAISIQLNGDCQAAVIISNKSQKVKRDTTLNFPNNLWLNAGQAVRVKARSEVGNIGSANVMIQGELYPVGKMLPPEKAPKGVPNHITEEETQQEAEEPLRSLGEMIGDMRREEVKV